MTWNMITFRELIENINATIEPGQQSSLEQWFEYIIDIPIEKLTVEDSCRAIRQELCIDQFMPKILNFLIKDSSVGECYDGELISELSTLKGSILKDQKNNFIKIKRTINQIDAFNISDDLKNNMSKINHIII